MSLNHNILGIESYDFGDNHYKSIGELELDEKLLTRSHRSLEGFGRLRYASLFPFVEVSRRWLGWKVIQQTGMFDRTPAMMGVAGAGKGLQNFVHVPGEFFRTELEKEVAFLTRMTSYRSIRQKSANMRRLEREGIKYSGVLAANASQPNSTGITPVVTANLSPADMIAWLSRQPSKYGGFMRAYKFGVKDDLSLEGLEAHFRKNRVIRRWGLGIGAATLALGGCVAVTRTGSSTVKPKSPSVTAAASPNGSYSVVLDINNDKINDFACDGEVVEYSDTYEDPHDFSDNKNEEDIKNRLEIILNLLGQVAFSNDNISDTQQEIIASAFANAPNAEWDYLYTRDQPTAGHTRVLSNCRKL